MQGSSRKWKGTGILSAKGAEGVESGEGVSLSLVGEGAQPPPQKIFLFFVWQWSILVHSGRLF